MKLKLSVIALIVCGCPASWASDLELKIAKLSQQTAQLQREIATLQRQVARQKTSQADKKNKPTQSDQKYLDKHGYHDAPVKVHSLDGHPESMAFYPSVLMAEDQAIAYIAGTPVVTSPYLGERPAFDGSDLIVNISSINQDVRLMQQRRRLYQAFDKLGYPQPKTPLIALSGAIEPYAFFGSPLMGSSSGDLDLGTAELDVAIAINPWVEGLISVGYDDSRPLNVNQRIANSNFYLNKGFLNIGNLDKSPFYATAGQIYVPFGRYSSSMVSSNLPQILGRTKARPVILGFKNQQGPGVFAAVYGFRGDTTLGKSGTGGLNAGYTFDKYKHVGEIGVSVISNIANSNGMQSNGAPIGTFGGFGSITNGSEAISKVAGIDAHINWSRDAYSITMEWVGAARRFRRQDLSFNGRGARPQAANVEAAYTFYSFAKPASLACGYQWSDEALALRLPRHRLSGVFNVSIWPNTVESIEYRHDMDYKTNEFANGASPLMVTNAPIRGTGRHADSVTAQIGMYF